MKVNDETGLQTSRQQEIKALQHSGCLLKKSEF